MHAIYCKSGLGNETYSPSFFFQTNYDDKFHHAILKAEQGMFSTVASLLTKTVVHPSRITVLIVACSMFAPSLSHSSLIVHCFLLPPSVKTFASSIWAAASAPCPSISPSGSSMDGILLPQWPCYPIHDSVGLSWVDRFTESSQFFTS
uniref:Probable 3-ketoacyl-CoA synthase 14 n=1 Tax=Elaeis guineensis var. tenera TaxID=51953 RepID=A0A6I9RWP6_ELAGV|nr:probable 3-ketoacyl-CoA synthase 14 [Elaeis guineensis]